MEGLKIVGLNLDTIWKDKNRNFSLIEAETLYTESDLILLPEMFSTGFCMEASEIADYEEETLSWMKSFARKKKSAVAGSVSVSAGRNFFNRFYFVKPDGSFEFYDKRHLFSHSGEDKSYTRGQERKIVEYKGTKFLLQICYDLRFPVFSRNIGDYDVALYVANWPGKRIFAWEQLLKARAIENQCYVFGLNRIGKDGYGINYPESSGCFFADGTLISQKYGSLVSAEVDMENLRDFREKFLFLEDRDDFRLIL